MLALGDLEGMTLEEVQNHIARDYAVGLNSVQCYEILIAYESVGDFGCDSSSFFLVRDASGQWFEIHGSHCSCNGFEGQWTPEETSAAALNWKLTNGGRLFYGGGYDDSSHISLAKAEDYVKRGYAAEQAEKILIKGET